MTLRVAFRVDSGITIGSGHLMRCLTLANELRSRGAEVIFISREHLGHMIDRIEASDYPVYRLPQVPKHVINDSFAWLGVSMEQDAIETQTLLSGQSYDWLVVDHYGLDIYWEQLLRPMVRNIMVIDDLANRQHDCTLLLDQNYVGEPTELRYKNRVSELCGCLLGPRYALLGSEYLYLRRIFLPHDGYVRRVLIFFGGSDQTNQTQKALTALTAPDLANLVVDVVIGTNHPDPQGIKSLVEARKGTLLHYSMPSLAGLMARSDLIIGAGGATTWERLSLGLPSLVISLAENQQRILEALSEDGFQLSLAGGSTTSIAEWYVAIRKLVNQPSELKRISTRAKELVDGLGTKRVARVLFGCQGIEIKLRPANVRDNALLFVWANDREVRLQSFQQKSISQDEHTEWFLKKINNSDCLLLIGEDEEGLPLGMVRFDINRECAEATINISIEQSLRGKGLSKKLLGAAIKQWCLMNRNVNLIANVRDKNVRSQQLFRTLNFESVPDRYKGAKTFELVMDANNMDKLGCCNGVKQ